MRSGRWLGLLVAIVLVSTSGAAHAALITWAFTGTVFQADTTGSTGIGVGMSVTGQFTYESTSTDFDPSSTRGTYFAITAATLDVPDATFSRVWTRFEGGFVPNVFDVNVSPNDSYNVNARDSAGPGELSVQLVAASPFASDALPLFPPAFSFGQIGWADFGNVTAGNSSFFATLDTLTLVPEPSSSLLLIAALGVMPIRRRWRGN